MIPAPTWTDPAILPMLAGTELPPARATAAELPDGRRVVASLFGSFLDRHNPPFILIQATAPDDSPVNPALLDIQQVLDELAPKGSVWALSFGAEGPGAEHADAVGAVRVVCVATPGPTLISGRNHV